MAPRVANWPPKFDGILFQPIQGHHKVQHFISNLGQIEKFFSISAWTPSVKPLGLILTFAPIGMLDLGWTLALNSKCKGGLTDNSLFPHTKQGRPANDPSCLQLLFSKRNLPRESISQLNWLPSPLVLSLRVDK